MAVTVTVGTNSYISVNDATTYLNNRLYVTEWTNASADDKARALIMATKKLDNLVLRGIKSVNTQTLQFPRAIFSDYLFYFYDEKQINVLNPYGYYVVETEVSQIVKDACCEEALAILKDYQSAEQRKRLQSQGVTSIRIGNLQEDYDSKSGKIKTLPALMSSEATMLMKPYLLSAGGGDLVIQDYLNQEVTLKTKTGVNEYNEPTFSSATVKARFEPDAKKIMLHNGDVITTKGRVFLWNAPNIGDRVTWGTFADLEIFEISGMIDIGGKIVGYECLLK